MHRPGNLLCKTVLYKRGIMIMTLHVTLIQVVEADYKEKE